MITSSHVIYESDIKDIVLLDLPRSIETAQSSPFLILSTAPPTRPYPSTEPKGSKLATALRAIDPDRLREQSDLEQSLSEALDKIHAAVICSRLPWCHPRCISTHPVSQDSEVECRNAPQKIDALDPGLTMPHTLSPIVLSSTEGYNVFRSMADVVGTVVCNPSQGTFLKVGETVYHVPPKSTFILSTILKAQPIFSAFGGQFDLILMDPPWVNRSVRRVRNYITDERQPSSVFLSIIPILKDHLNQNGIVAVWITNNPKVAELVLTALGSVGLHLQQEWVWLKITSAGKPVTDINGVWRKPYEELLLFGHTAQPVSRRVIVAVPDIHSRKPSLKRWFDELLPSDSRVLELFARSLTAGWWSCGDQVLHFQDTDNWTSAQSIAHHEESVQSSPPF